MKSILYFFILIFSLLITNLKAQINFNIVQNPGFEEGPTSHLPAKPEYCPSFRTLSIGIPGITYPSSIIDPTNLRIPPWSGTDSEYYFGPIRYAANNCTGQLYLFPNHVNGTNTTANLYPPNHTNNNSNQVFVGVWGQYGAVQGYRTEYLNGILKEPINPGIEYDVNYDFTLAPSLTKIGFKQLGVLFYNNQQNTINYAVPPNVTSADQLFKIGFNLSDQQSDWDSKGAGIFLSKKQNGVWGDKFWPNNGFGWEKVNEIEKLKYKTNYSGQNAVTLGFFYQSHVPGNPAAYLNPSHDLDAPESLTGYTRWAQNPLPPANSYFSGYSYYDNINVSCTSRPFFKVNNLDEKFNLIGTFFQRDLNQSVKCNENVDLIPLRYSTDHSQFGNFIYYRWRVVVSGVPEGSTNTVTKEFYISGAKTLNALETNELGDDYKSTLFSHSLPAPFTHWEGLSVQVFMESSCSHLATMENNWSQVNTGNEEYISFIVENGFVIKQLLLDGIFSEGSKPNLNYYVINRDDYKRSNLKNYDLNASVVIPNDVKHYTIKWKILNKENEVIYTTTTNSNNKIEFKVDDKGQSHFLLELGEYRVVAEILYDSRCKSETIEILLNVVEETPDLYIPNILKPDSAVNGRFGVFAKPGNKYQFIKLQIFDRFGDLVFSSPGNSFDPEDFNSQWDGRYNGTGKELNPGVYVYVLEIKLPDGKSKTIKGDVTLVR